MCTSPLLGIRYCKIDKETGKNVFKIQKYSGILTTEDLKPIYEFGEKERIMIPCGQCIECRLEYSRMWADRIMLEAKYWQYNQFVTLTYDNEHLPINEFIDEEGTVMHSETLLPEDVTKFMKDLRRYYKYHYNHDNIRVYLAGEYGDVSGRPHYHFVLFNLPIEDKIEIFHKDGYSIYTSETLEKIWKKGLVSVADVCWESAAYVARYVMKKQKGKNAKFYEERHIEPEFVRMSRKPGIGQNYYEQNKDEIYKYDSIAIKNSKGDVFARKPPKYFDKLYEKENPEHLKDLQWQRKKSAEQRLKMQDRMTELNLRQRLNDKKRIIDKQTEVLKFRNLIEFD